MRLKSLKEMRHELPLPQKLVEMIGSGRWVHPGDDVMLTKVPFIRDPLVFLDTKDKMLFESGPLMRPDEIENEMFCEYRGSVVGKRALPWIDVEQTLFVICNKWPGDDVGIALDYRIGKSPRVVGSDCYSSKNSVYREISPSFDAFVQLLGL